MAPDYFENLWDWTDFTSRFLSHTNPEIRWIVCQCLAHLSGMAENSKIKLMAQQNIPEEEIRKYTLKYYRKLNFSLEPFHHQSSKVRYLTERKYSAVY